MNQNLINQIDNALIDEIGNGNNFLADEYLTSIGYDLDEINYLKKSINNNFS